MRRIGCNVRGPRTVWAAPLAACCASATSTCARSVQLSKNGFNVASDLRPVNMVMPSGSSCRSHCDRLISVNREKRFSNTSGGKYVAPVHERSSASDEALPQIRRRYPSTASMPFSTTAAGGWIHLQRTRVKNKGKAALKDNAGSCYAKSTSAGTRGQPPPPEEMACRG